MLPTKLGVSWPFGSEEAKNRLLRWQPWGPSWISNQNDFSYFDLVVTSMLPLKFQDNPLFVSGEEAKKYIFKMTAILDFPSEQHFLSTSHPDASYQVSCQLAFQFRRSKK